VYHVVILLIAVGNSGIPIGLSVLTIDDHCCCPDNFPAVSELFWDADDQLFSRTSHIQTHVQRTTAVQTRLLTF